MTGSPVGVLSANLHSVQRCCALVVVKRRAVGRSQLAGCLSPPVRVSLIRDVLGNVLRATSDATCIARTVVVSPERDTVPEEIELIADQGQGLNEALPQARLHLAVSGVRWLFVLPADLPRVSSADLDCPAAKAGVTGVATAPDEAGTGTNALSLRADLAFEVRFGPGRRARHVGEARRIGIRAGIVRRPGLAMDVDLPDHLLRLRSDEVPA